MLPSELQELRLLTRSQIARKYTPALISRRITLKQFKWLLSQGLLAPQETPKRNEEDEGRIPQQGMSIEEIAKVFNGWVMPEESEGRNQKGKLLNLLKDKQWHSTSEILQKVYGGVHLGIARAGARIYDLRIEGYEIESQRKAGTIWEYRLK